MGQFLHEAIDFEQGEEVDLSGFSSSELFEKLRDFVVSGIGRDPVIQELHEKYVQRLYEDGGKTGASSVADSMPTMQEELTEQEQLDLAIQLSLNSSGANTTLEQEELTEQEQLDLAIQLSLNSSGANTTLEQEGLTEQEQLDLAIQLILRGYATLEQQSCTMLPSSTD